MKKIRCLAALLLVCLLLQPVFSCFATESVSENDTASEPSASEIDAVSEQPTPDIQETSEAIVSDTLQLPTGF